MQGSDLLADSGELYDTTHRGGRLGTCVFSQALVLFSNLKTSCLQVCVLGILDAICDCLSENQPSSHLQFCQVNGP